MACMECPQRSCHHGVGADATSRFQKGNRLRSNTNSYLWLAVSAHTPTMVGYEHKEKMVFFKKNKRTSLINLLFSHIQLTKFKEANMTKEEQLKKLQQQREKIARKIAVKQRQLNAESRKRDAHQKIMLGASVLAVLGRPYEEGDEYRLLAFLKSQETRGGYFSVAMNAKKPEEESGYHT